MSDPGFVFWGLFLACGAVLVAYVLWMVWEERRGRGGPAREDADGGTGPHGGTG